MARFSNLVVNYDAIFGISVSSVECKGVCVKQSPDKAKVKTLKNNDSKAFHLRRPKLT